jgi:hypothetical protein
MRGRRAQRSSTAGGTTPREYDVPMPVANLAEQIVIEAMNRGGWGDRDSSITFRLQEEAAGVEVRAPTVDPFGDNPLPPRHSTKSRENCPSLS